MRGQYHHVLNMRTTFREESKNNRSWSQDTSPTGRNVLYLGLYHILFWCLTDEEGDMNTDGWEDENCTRE